MMNLTPLKIVFYSIVVLFLAIVYHDAVPLWFTITAPIAFPILLIFIYKEEQKDK